MIKGSCLCGAVAYEADVFDGPMTHCHCRTCQKAHGAAFATSARVRRGDFRWTRGESDLAAFESTAGKLRRFCSRCGSQLTAERLDAPVVTLRIGCVDEGLDTSPEAHVWVSDQAPWDLARDGLPRFAECRVTGEASIHPGDPVGIVRLRRGWFR